MQSSKIYIYYLISLKLLNNMIEPFQKRKVNKRRDDWQKQVEFCTYYSWQEYKITAVGKYLGPYWIKAEQQKYLPSEISTVWANRCWLQHKEERERMGTEHSSNRAAFTYPTQIG